MNRPAADQDTTTSNIDKVVEVALETFARQGFEDTRLENIAHDSGMSKRMIHYHFGDKRGLYIRALRLAISQLRPEPQALELDSTVPVDGVRKVVEAIFRQMAAHPNAIRLLLLENLFGQADMANSNPLADQSSVLLQMDKLLMMGQDAGAFRPGISALDVYTIISSMCVFRIAYPAAFKNLYHINLKDEENNVGMQRLVVDAVLAFLTSNMRNSGGMSYLTVETSNDFNGHDSNGSGNIYNETRRRHQLHQ